MSAAGGTAWREYCSLRAARAYALTMSTGDRVEERFLKSLIQACERARPCNHIGMMHLQDGVWNVRVRVRPLEMCAPYHIHTTPSTPPR